jgi:hypothetical protein
LGAGHNVQIVVGLDRKEVENFVEHLAVLGRDAHDRLDRRARRIEREHHRGHLDRIRTGPHHGHYTEGRHA